MDPNRNLQFTTLVLGAGASMGYGYPSGLGLIDEVKKRLSLVESIPERQFLKDLQDNRPRSIDAFLRAHPRHSNLAKPLIAEILYHLEDPDWARGPNDLYDQIVHEIPVERYGDFKIITFNYDRSLEYFLAQQTHTSLSGGIPEAYKALANLEVIHIHGRLSELPHEERGPKLSNGRFPTPNGQACMPYGAYRDKVSRIPDAKRMGAYDYEPQLKDPVWELGRKFVTVYENHDRNVKACEILAKSARIYFLGFSYHPLNMRILGFDDDRKQIEGQRIAGTCYKLQEVELERLKKAFSYISFFPCNVDRFFQDLFDITT